MPTSAAAIDNAASRTASTAFGIQRDDSGQGTSPYDVRSIIDAIYINTGVVKGLEVTGGSDLTYTVAPGTAVCSKADADGKTLAPWHGGKTPAVNAGDPSNPRIDIVWIIAHNLVEDGDSDNLVTIGVTQGTPAVTPAAPAIPSGALPLQRFLMPAKALTTGAAVRQDQPTYAIQQGGSLGLLGEYWFKIDRSGPHKLNQSNYDLAVKVNLPTARYVDLLYKTCFSGEGSRGSQDTSHPSEYHICFQLDGKEPIRYVSAVGSDTDTHHNSTTVPPPGRTAADGWGNCCRSGTRDRRSDTQGERPMASWQPYLCDTVTGQIETPIDLPAFSWSVSVSDSSLATLKEKGLGDETVSGLTVPWTSLPGDTPSARRRSISTDRTSVALLWKDADDDSLGRPILMGSIGVRQDKALDTSFTLNSPMAMLADRYVIREGKYGTGPNGTSPDVITLTGLSYRGIASEVGYLCTSCKPGGELPIDWTYRGEKGSKTRQYDCWDVQNL